ncbi:MAG: methyl-accepting chemotaxis protein [Pseudorhodoplanes sp.]|jgi:methyl-accepting chemotaxis protein|nr:methyl-accepting chemotaxis protein [Pseudorhodoplanes sp.]
MLRLPAISISTKLYALFALLGTLTVVLAGYAVVNSRNNEILSEQLQSAFAGAQNVERVNSLIYAVVMESRGIYMSPDIKTAKRFGNNLLKFNGQIADVVSAWKGVVQADDAAQFEAFSKRIAQFQDFRRELVRLGTEVDPKAGRQWGDNEANRSVRSALNKDLEALAQLYKRRAERINAELAAAIERMGLVMGALGVIAILCAVTGVLITWRSVVRPLAQLVKTMGILARGDLTVDVDGQRRGDEVGSMAKAVQVFKDNALALRESEAQAEEQRRAADEERARNETARAEASRQVAKVVEGLGAGLERLASGDLTYRLTDQFSADYVKIQDDFNSAITQLQETIKNIAQSTSEVSNAASEISTSTTNLSQRTEEQAASLEETSASMEEILVTVRKNAENAQHANQLAQNTREIANRGGTVAAEAVTAMARIEESSRKIADIISVIDEIARQTNLLALNAAVEAARAGEAGRGFAVVASEVRSLAQRSAQAAKDIKDLIINSAGQVHEGVELVNKAGTSLHEIVDSIKDVAAIVADIAAASSDQASGIDQINKALSQMDEATQQNSALVEENAATAKTLEDQQLAMSEQVGFFSYAPATRQVAEKPSVVTVLKRPAGKAVRRGGTAVAVAAEQEWQEF